MTFNVRPTPTQHESLGVYAADVLLCARRGSPDYPAAIQEGLALHTFLRGLAPERLRQHVLLTRPQTVGAALDEAERAEVTLSPQPSRKPSRCPGGRGWGSPLPWHNDSGVLVRAGRAPGPRAEAAGSRTVAVSAAGARRRLRLEGAACHPSSSQPPAWPSTGQTSDGGGFGLFVVGV